MADVPLNAYHFWQLNWISLTDARKLRNISLASSPHWTSKAQCWPYFPVFRNCSLKWEGAEMIFLKEICYKRSIFFTYLMLGHLAREQPPVMRGKRGPSESCCSFPPWTDVSLTQHAKDLGLGLTLSLDVLLWILKLFRPVKQNPR